MVSQPGVKLFLALLLHSSRMGKQRPQLANYCNNTRGASFVLNDIKGASSGSEGIKIWISKICLKNGVFYPMLGHLA